MRTLYIGCDHNGTLVLDDIYNFITKHYPTWDVQVLWSGKESDDYPDIAHLMAKKMENDPTSRCLLVCGSAVGIAMASNRYRHIRAVAGYDAHDEVRMARKHEDCNVLCLSAWWSPLHVIQAQITTFLSEPFDGGRHLRRIYKMTYV